LQKKTNESFFLYLDFVVLLQQPVLIPGMGFMGTSETTHSQNFNYLYDFCSVCWHVSLCRFTLTPSSLICAFRL